MEKEKLMQETNEQFMMKIPKKTCEHVSEKGDV